MTRRLRIVSFIAVLGCFALSDGFYYLGFELWPPSATMADGTKTPFRSVEMEVCLKERAVAWLGDRSIAFRSARLGLVITQPHHVGLLAVKTNDHHPVEKALLAAW